MCVTFTPAAARIASPAAMSHSIVRPPRRCRSASPDAIIPNFTADDIGAFVAINDAAYQTLGMPAGVIAAAVLAPERVLAPHVRTVIAWEGDQPLATVDDRSQRLARALTRYDKLAIVYRAAVVLNAAIAWLHHLSDTP